MWIKIVTIFVVLQGILFIQCRHAKVDTAEMLSNSTLKKLNQTGIDQKIELMRDKAQAKVPLTNATVASNSTSSIYIEDFTNFVTQLNDWVILGQWARYHLTFFTGDKPVPKIPSYVDQTVLICTVSKFPSKLTKDYVGLSNSVLTLLHYVNFEKDISIEGLISSDNKTEVFFALNKDDLYERNNTWIVSKFNIPKHVNNMTIILQPRSSGNATWAIGSIKINGTQQIYNVKTAVKIQPNITTTTTTTTNKPVVVTTANATTPPTTIVGNTTQEVHNASTAKPLDNSTALPLVNLTVSEIKQIAKKSGNYGEHPLKEIHGIASAIWDAFYVFLALFCACMIALVILIVRQR